MAYHIAVGRRVWRGTQRPGLQSTSIGPVLAPAALDGPTMDHLSLKLDDGHSGVFVSVQLDECEATISLHAYLRQISDRLEKWDQVRLSAIRDEIANVDGRVIRGRLLYDRLVRERATQEIHRSWGSSATAHRRTSRSGGGTTLSLLIGPVDTNGSRAEPLAIHCGNGLLSIGLVAKCQETVATRLARVHVPHDTGIGQGAKSGKCLGEDIIVDLGGEVANENMEVVGRVLLVLLALIRPIHTDLRVEDLTTIESLKGGLRGTHIHVLDEAIVKAAVLVIAVWDDLDVLNRTSHSKYLRKHVLGHPRAQISHVEVGPLLTRNCKDQDEIVTSLRAEEIRNWSLCLSHASHRVHTFTV